MKYIVKTKDYSKDKNTVLTYYEIGKLLSEAGSKYGTNIIEEYAKKLQIEVGKKYNRRTLFRMKQFYNVFSNEKVSPLVTQLSWTHYVILISLNDTNKINYYMSEAIAKNLSKRELENIIKNKTYERLPDETKVKLVNKEKPKVKDLVKNPILINNKNNYEVISEKILQRLIIEDIPVFLKELGTGFSFIENEYKIKLGSTYNYIDLLLYNIDFNCYIVLELKITELKKEHIGQIEVYMN